VQLQKDALGDFVGEVALPGQCTFGSVVISGVCCYRYLLSCEYARAPSMVREWHHDATQPTDTDADGRVKNIVCEYTADAMRPPPQLNRGGSGGESGGANQSVAALPPQAEPLCFFLPATKFVNGSTLRVMGSRVPWGCCDACRRLSGCAAFNWQAEPASSNCVLLSEAHGTPQGSALSSAGMIRRPALNPVAPAHAAASVDATSAVHAKPVVAAAPGAGQQAAKAKALKKKRRKPRKGQRQKHARAEDAPAQHEALG